MCNLVVEWVTGIQSTFTLVLLDQSLDSQLIMRLLVSHPWKTQACRQSINSTCSAFVQNI